MRGVCGGAAQPSRGMLGVGAFLQLNISQSQSHIFGNNRPHPSPWSCSEPQQQNIITTEHEISMDVPTLDKCPGYNLYIGGFIALRRPQALKNCNITHIVSVLDWKFDDDTPLTRGYQHLHIPVDDVEDENLLAWFPRSNAFIQQGIDQWKNGKTGTSTGVATPKNASENGSGVLIHCAMGKSRSATILLAYLLWSTRQPTAETSVDPTPLSPDSDMISLPRKPLTVLETLELLRRGRPIAEPNEGFMDQLYMYQDMGCPTTEAEMLRHKIYRRWMNKRSVEESLRVNQAPEMDAIQFEDEADSESNTDTDSKEHNEAKVQTLKQQAKQEKADHMSEVVPGISAPDGTAPLTSPSTITSMNTIANVTTIKCRKCRHTLATTPFVLPHSPPPHRDPSGNTTSCAHIFLHPLSWMRPVLATGQLEGRLTCPNLKCKTNIGKFAWSGLRCNCGGWVTPGFGVNRGKVDEAFQNNGSDRLVGARGGDISDVSKVRMPPGRDRGHL